MDKVGGLPNVAVNLDTLSTEGILFDHIYANSFRTDRGLVSIISGFPAPPVNSLMKYPAKSQSLPSISKSLKAVGYETEYYYGGDVNFTNMRSYLASQEFGKVMSDVDFPISERLSKWGVHDHLLFQRAIEAIRSDKDNTPTFRVIQTTSSHEPYEVPYHRLENERLNAFAYTDSVVGDFIRQYKLLPQWKNTLVVLIPDHLGAYPENITNTELARYQIPMIWIGGAVSGPQRVNTIGSQHDFAATLLGQLGLDHSAFFFSKDLLDATVPHFAFFSVPDLFGIVDEDNQLIYDNQLGRTVLDEGNVKSKNLKRGQAYLQRIYDVISNL
jgi:phosphoglycerol transferase MdoB-like AlkP superfamily enzyme